RNSTMCNYRVYALTGKAVDSETTNPLEIRFHTACAVSQWYSLEDSEHGHQKNRHYWYKYFLPVMDSPLVGVTVKIAGEDGWGVENIHVENLCTKRVFDMNCQPNLCVVDRPHAPKLFIPVA
ncbi:unnamed protein product, partial [Owenia fusiformis]